MFYRSMRPSGGVMGWGGLMGVCPFAFLRKIARGQLFLFWGLLARSGGILVRSRGEAVREDKICWRCLHEDRK